MQKIAHILICTSVIACITSCTTQKPVSQAPVYNITLTDNSQWIVGDSNTADSRPTTKADQAAKPKTDAQADNTTSNMWIFWLVMVAVLAAGGYLAYRKWWK